jgi:hypothetical protein
VHKFSRLKSSLRAAATVAGALCILGLVSGCAVANPSASLAPESAAVTISGRVHGGQQPLSGSVVQLWETGTTGYGTGAAQLVAQTTTAVGTGAFTFPTSNVPGNCTSGPFAYITAAGGDPSGLTTSDLNPAILLAAVVPGTCSTTNGSTFIEINEETTIAAAYALSGFATTSGSAGSLATLNVGAPSTNAQGLSDAFANANTLVNSMTGAPNVSTATMLLPSTTINSLANTISACVNTSSNTSTSCSTLFSLTTPPNGTAPTNTFAATVNMAKYPGSNVTALLNLATAAAPFQPTLPSGSTTAVINDLTLGIAFPNSTLAGAKDSAAALAIDATDDVWVLGAETGTTSTTFNYITELSNATTGYAVTNTLASTATLNGTHNIRNGAFDTLGNLWMADGSVAQVIEIPSGTGAAGATAYPFSSLNADMAANDYTVVVDGSNNVWTSSYRAQGSCQGPASTTSNTVCEFLELQKGSSTYTAANTFNGNQVGNLTARGMAADAKTGNIWAANYGLISPNTTPGNTVEILNPTTGVAQTVTVGGAGAAPVGIAIDASSNGWVTTPTIAGLYFVPAGSTSSSTIAAANVANPPSTILNTTSAPASTATTAVAVGGLNTDTYDAIDGAGNVWIANAGNSAIAEYAPAYNCGSGCTGAFLSPNYGFSPSIATVANATNESLFTCTTTTTTTCAIAGGAITGSNTQIAVDRAGSVWTLTGKTGSLVEIVGTAAPTNPIQAAGQYGVQP